MRLRLDTKTKSHRKSKTGYKTGSRTAKTACPTPMSSHPGLPPSDRLLVLRTLEKLRWAVARHLLLQNPATVLLLIAHSLRNLLPPQPLQQLPLPWLASELPATTVHRTTEARRIHILNSNGDQVGMPMATQRASVLRLSLGSSSPHTILLTMLLSLGTLPDLLISKRYRRRLSHLPRIILRNQCRRARHPRLHKDDRNRRLQCPLRMSQLPSPWSNSASQLLLPTLQVLDVVLVSITSTSSLFWARVTLER